MENKVEITIKENSNDISVTLEASNINVEHLLAVGKTVLESAVDMLVNLAKENGVYNKLKDEIKSAATEDIEDIYNHMKEYIENK